MAVLNCLKLFFLIGIPYISCGTKETGPVGDLKLIYISDCEPVVEDEITLKVELKTVENEEKATDVLLILPFDIDEEAEILVVTDKWKDGVWQNEFYKTDGKMFEFIAEYLPDIWTNLREKAEPNIPDDNLIPAGEYTLKNFQDSAVNVKLPKIFYGRLKITVYVIKDDNEIACKIMELDSIEKD